MKKVPLVDLKAQYQIIKPEIDSAIQRVISNSTFILGKEVSQFEDAFATYCEAEYCIGVSSGTSALHLAMLACDIGPGDEVITTTFTFTATAESIWMAGARPVFVDIDPINYNLDPSRIEGAITSRTKAILLVHLYGQPVDLDNILEIAKRHDLVVIEDAAQAHGARYTSRRVGAIGDIGIFSFYPGKNLGAYGDGGAIVTNNEELANKARLLRNHGRAAKYEHLQLGYGYRLDALQAAILGAKLPHMDTWNEARRVNAQHYDERLKNAGFQPPAVHSNVEHVYHLYVIQVDERDLVKGKLNMMGIGAGIHYPLPLHLQPAFAYLGYKTGDFPHAEIAATRVLSLPMYPELEESQIKRIVLAVGMFVTERLVY